MYEYLVPLEHKQNVIGAKFLFSHMCAWHLGHNILHPIMFCHTTSHPQGARALFREGGGAPLESQSQLFYALHACFLFKFRCFMIAEAAAAVKVTPRGSDLEDQLRPAHPSRLFHAKRIM